MVRLRWVVCGFVSVALTGTAARAGTKVDDDVTLGGSRAATWYLPDAQPETWVYLQHGYSRNKGHVDDLATELMDRGLMVLAVNCDVSGGNGSLARDVADDIIDAPPIPPDGFALPPALVVSGHSAGGLFATHMGARMSERAYAGLKGLVLLDPVDADSVMQDNMQATLDAGKSVYAILANPGSCNSSGNARAPLESLTAPFVGIQLTDNSKHTDAEGSSSGFPLTWMCGSPQSHNIDYLQDFATHWALDLGSGTATPAYYPGGAKIQELVDTNDGELIKEWSGPVCGNGIVEDGEECDGGGCCDNFCRLVEYGAECRAASNECDLAEVCDGVVAECPVDQVEPNGTPCAGGAKECWGGQCVEPPACGNGVVEPGEDCDGGACCEADCSLSVSGAECRAASNECDIAEVCDGAVASCPADVFAPDGTTCSIGMCQGGVCVDQPTGWVVLIHDTDLAGADGSFQYWQMVVPAGSTDVEIETYGGSGDVDLYVKKDGDVSRTSYDCRPYEWGNDESCSFTGGGTYSIMLYGYDSFAGVTLDGRYYFPEP